MELARGHQFHMIWSSDGHTSAYLKTVRKPKERIFSLCAALLFLQYAKIPLRMFRYALVRMVECDADRFCNTQICINFL